MKSKSPTLARIPDTINDRTDGRRRRSELSRQKILQAVWELMLEGDLYPGVAAIAKHAGVGQRSVFRHFEDMDTLYRELLAEAEAKLIHEFMKPFTTQTWQEQLLELVNRRANIWEKIMVPHTAGEIRRFKSPVLMDDYNRSRLKEISMIKAILPDELIANQSFLMSLDLTLCFASWRRLRKERQLSIEDAKNALRFAIHALIDQIDEIKPCTSS